MSRRSLLIALCSSGLCLTTIVSGQQTNSAPQTGQPAQPSPSVYGRMRRSPVPQGQQPTAQAQRFPSPAQQFPPEQTAPVGQRPAITFPHPNLPAQQAGQQPQTPAQAQTAPQPQSQAGMVLPQPGAAQPTVQQPQQPSGAEQQPPNPPRVSLVGGMLTVAAENSTLADVLKAVGTVTHASLEGTQPDAERVFGQFGPAAPRQVLNSILNGSHYDFILVGAVDDQGSVDRIMLSPHGTAPAVRGNASQMAARQNIPNPNPDEDDTDNSEAAVQPEIQQTPPPPVPSEQVQPPAPQQQQQVKTPEQLLQELQRLRQQQQQQAPGNNPR